jgi:ubiquinone/menaquinone biosynthesis C-methylase UbiE
MADYLNVIYDELSHPKTEYPDLLAIHLFTRFSMSPGKKLLEPGCGRGDFLNGFRKLGLECYGVDLSPQAGGMLEGIEVKQANFDSDRLLFEDNHFDFIYHKSVLEHLQHPDFFLRECWRILKPNGVLISLVPDWEANYKIYFDDFTHRTPFTIVSLSDIYRMCDYHDVQVTKFRQLPIVWRFPILNLLSAAIAPFVPVRTKTKFLRWSRELMLLGSGVKPSGS